MSRVVPLLTEPAQVEVAHGVGFVLVQSVGRNPGFAFVLSADAARDLARGLQAQAVHARRVEAGEVGAVRVQQLEGDEVRQVWVPAPADDDPETDLESDHGLGEEDYR